MARNVISGRSAFLALLKQEGVTYLFGNPGTTELPIMHALADHPDLTYVMSMHESLVVGMADGYARGSGRLGACNVHVAPGLGNAMGSLFNAKFTNTPLILTAGQQEQGHGLTEPLLYDNLARIAEPLVKWAVEVTRLADLPLIVHRAAKVAMTPPTGPVFISLPGDILNAEDAIELGASTRVDSRARPSDDVLAAMADRILAAQRPVIIAGDEIYRSDALAEAARLAETIGAPAMQQGFASSGCFPSEHRCYTGLLPKVQPATRKALADYDLMIVLGCDPLRTSVASETDPLPPGLAIMQIGLDDWQIAKTYAVETPVRADIRETLRALVPLLDKKGGPALKAQAEARMTAFAERNWSSKRAKLAAAIAERPATRPIDVDQFALRLVEALPREAIVVHEGFTSTHHLPDLLAFRDRFGFHNGGSGGIGWSVPASIGVAMAQPERPVVTVVGDGSAMFSIQALWTMAHHRLPITTVICNNGGYRIIKQRLNSFHGSRHFVGMDFVQPSVDFVALAGSMGVEAQRITDIDELGPALGAAISRRTPVLLDVVVDNKV
jgi:benzoylformate decarboxylase